MFISLFNVFDRENMKNSRFGSMQLLQRQGKSLQKGGLCKMELHGQGTTLRITQV